MSRDSNYPIHIPVRVRVHDTIDGLHFDVIDSQNYVKEFRLDKEQHREIMTNGYRGQERQLIQKLIEEYVIDTLPTGTNFTLQIYFY